MMTLMLVAVAFICSPGDRLVDFRNKIAVNQRFIDILLTVQPAYTRFYIYQPGFPDSFQQCCGDKPSGVLRVPVLDGQFCIRQSQPQMKWRAQVILRPELSL
jgi:hypothetical protein